MGLQVWLPLNGDLNNLGLSNLQLTINTTPTYVNNGKIGKALSAGAVTMSAVNAASILNNQEFSFACWIYVNADAGDTTKKAMLFGTEGMTAPNNRKFSIFQYPTCNDLHLSWQNDVTNTTFTGGVWTGYFPSYKWTHVAITYKNPNGTIYINGEKKSTFSGISDSSSFSFNTRLFGNCVNDGRYLNDYRIYDHALSTKEVEEISKGLILHYKFDDSYAESSSFLTSEITNTAYNSPISKYGYNETSNLGKINGYFQGKYCTKIYTLADDQTSQPYTYFSNLFTSDGTNSPVYKTLSFDYYTTVPTTTWLNIYKLGNGSGTATWKTINSQGIKSGVYTNSSNSILVQPGEWNHVEVTFQGTTPEDAQWGYCINGPRYTSNSSYYFLYANIQLELNNHATGYGEKMHSNTFYDSSGYENNGIVNGACIFLDNSAKYNKSLYIPLGQTDYIVTKEPVCYDGSAVTMNIWFKSNNKSPGSSYHHCFNGFTDWTRVEMAVHSGGYLRCGLYINGTRYVANTNNTDILNGEWHMLTMTYDGTNVKRYVDAILKSTQAATGKIDKTNIKLIFGHGGASPGYHCKEAYLSDARLYCTALTAEQIKELYNTSASVDKSGNMYAREVVE